MIFHKIARRTNQKFARNLQITLSGHLPQEEDTCQKLQPQQSEWIPDNQLNVQPLACRLPSQHDENS